MKKNTKHFDLRICVESIAKGVTNEIRYAQVLRREIFETDEEFRLYFGLKIDAPVLSIIFGN